MIRPVVFLALPFLVLASHAAAGTTMLRHLGFGDFGSSSFRVALSPAEEHVYAVSLPCCYVAERLGVFSRDAGTGLLTNIQTLDQGVAGVDGLRGPTGIVVSPDGQHVYVTARSYGTVATFDRNTASGALSFTEVLAEGVGGVSGIAGANDLVVSPDGQHAYVAGRISMAVTAFHRDPGTGMLTLFEEHTEGVDGVFGLQTVEELEISPDGLHLYASGSSSPVVLFQRNPTTGALTFDGDALAAPLPNGRRSMRLDPSGARVYLASYYVGLEVAARDAGTGLLTPIASYRDDEHGLEFEFLSGVAISPDETTVYAGESAGLVQFDFNLDTGTISYAGRFTQGGRYSAQTSSDGRFLYTGWAHVEVLGTEAACPPDPAAGCATPFEPGKTKLAINDRDGGRKDKLTWKWAKGDETFPADLGDPTSTSSYALCVYDASANPQPLAVLRAPASDTCTGTNPNLAVECWHGDPVVGTRYSYRDTSGLSPDGISIAKFRAGAAGRSDVRLKARGGAEEQLDLPGLPLTAPVRVQMRNLETGACWESLYDTLKKNDASKVRG